VFLQRPEDGRFKILYGVAMSQPIVDEKSLTKLSIVELSHCNAIWSGGKEIILLCEKVWCELRSFPDFSMKVLRSSRETTSRFGFLRKILEKIRGRVEARS
jgi:hypothetical protein